MMRENFGVKSFQQELISNGLKIICKVLREIYTPQGYRGGGGPAQAAVFEGVDWLRVVV
jgi:hypothetical protein